MASFFPFYYKVHSIARPIQVARKMTNASILIIEGKKADRPSFATLLQKKDFIVTSVGSGSEALARLVEIGPDLVVVNAASLGSTGARICQSLRVKQDEHLPIVLVLEADKLAD